MRWMTERMAASAGMDVPVFPGPGHHQDPSVAAAVSEAPAATGPDRSCRLPPPAHCRSVDAAGSVDTLTGRLMQRRFKRNNRATSGLGAAAALALSKEGFCVVLGVISNIRRLNKDAHLEGLEVDLSSFSSIMSFKNSLENWLLDSDMHPSIQLLINNAGILATSRLTTDGRERMMGTNYIGAFSLTEVLLPLLKNSPIPSRIVNVTSFTHRNVLSFQPDKETVSGKRFLDFRNYPCAQIYEYSKFCLLLLSYELHRRLNLTEGSQKISVMAADPGAVKTNIMREVPMFISQAAFASLRFFGLLQSPKMGVSSICDAALAPPEASGLYFFGGRGRTVDSSPLSYNLKLSRELWATSCDIFQDLLQIYNKVSVRNDIK
ncbi:hypothetical protein E3N88_17288 [Mikania micrantha]|uniref:Uncharacterized protein n=1 Tax=Mikania micrantha TaxID=192012 RepID=A0A5N6NRE7_9ASTR|nr:hypothetical protein E3N88_17288 [Mikania micrantha]